jgi:ParB family chromosome partitioning protein
MGTKQAIDGTRLNAFAVDPEDLTLVGLDTKDGPEHPLYDERVHLPVDENLAKDMLMNGFRGSIEVRKNGDKMEVVFGRQRVKAARKANKWAAERGKEPVKVTVFAKKGSDSDMFGIRIGENIHRKSMGILAMADDLKKYLDFGRSEEEAAVTFGMTKANIKNLMRLHDLDNTVRKAVEAEKLSPSAAAELSGMSREDQKEALAKLLESGEKVTHRTAKHAAKVKKKGSEEVTIAPPKRLITKILKLDKKEGVLTEDFVRGVMWTLGDIRTASIKGLTALENTAKAPKTRKE